MEIQYWPIDPATQKEAEENYRTKYALSLEGKEPLEIIRELTFDGVVPNITLSDIERLFDYVERFFLIKPLAGIGVEVGAGPLTFSSILAKRSQVTRMYGVEICKPIVEQLYPKVSRLVAGDLQNKVAGVVGSFDKMQLPDVSVDFVFDFFSLHHSLHLPTTLNECARILKPGGFVLCFDKARPDSHSEDDLNELLDKIYPESYNSQFGLPAGTKITRRINGEREYRLKDWRMTFLQNGFSRFEHFALVKTDGGGLVTSLVKLILGTLPPWFQKNLNRFLPNPRHNHKFTHSSENMIFVPPINSFRKEISLMIAYK